MLFNNLILYLGKNMDINSDNSSIKTVFWNDIKDEIETVNPEFAGIINKLNPDEKLSLYLVEFPYGDLVGDDISQFIPDNRGGYYRLTSDNAPENIKEDLGYGASTSPLGLLLEKKIEFFVDIPHRNITIPNGILSPGGFYNTSIVLSKFKNTPYNPNGILKASSGARTVFSMPYLTCKNSFSRLQSELGPISVPNSYYEHAQLFKDMLTAQRKTKWRSRLVYFSKDWINNIIKNPLWSEVKGYLAQKSWENSEHDRNQFYFDIAYSLIQENTSLNNPYLTDTAKHIFDISLGAYPGLAPASNEDFFPLKTIQHMLIYSYGIKKYIPTIIVPEYFNASNKSIYYTLQHPTTKSFSPRSNNTISTLKNLDILKLLIMKFTQQITDRNGVWSGSYLQETVNNLKISYIHNNSNSTFQPESPEDVIENDGRFFYTGLNTDSLNLIPAADAKFFRGCISLSKH